MLLTDEDIEERINSPLNLLNRLRKTSEPKIPSMPPTSKDLELDVEGSIAARNLRGKAAAIMGKVLIELEHRIPDIQKPEKLAQIATEMNKVLNTNKDDDNRKAAQIIVYAPQVVNENHFQEMVVQEDRG
jgi:hypothetical protein